MSLPPAPPSASRSTMTELMMPNTGNNLGHVFRAVILSLIDRVGAVAAVRADRIIVLEEGRIVESGTHDELLAAHGVYAALHRMQFSV